ncbi:hypothetical protein Bca52824_032550 [Brassica carinata]|uniref:Uncharacterized protein n=1 Tax=Brassica carinata TaxID=52824 RepID=A0A8X7V6A9_BRACI|nr:hypothetical protein Bca52824_032550 [Brassica carinata]
MREAGRNTDSEHNWTEVQGKPYEAVTANDGRGEARGITVSPSRFQALADISEEEEAGNDDPSENEEGEIVADSTEKKRSATMASY